MQGLLDGILTRTYTRKSCAASTHLPGLRGRNCDTMKMLLQGGSHTILCGLWILCFNRLELYLPLVELNELSFR